MPELSPVALLVEISSEIEGNAEDLEMRVVHLRDELRMLDVDDVERAYSGIPPAGAKAAEAYSLYSLIVSLSDSVAIASVITLLQSWISRNKGISATIQIGGDKVTVKDMSAAQIAKIVESLKSK
jgi:hypothetical protein